MEKLYTNKIGVEFEHVLDVEEREWLYNRYEKIMNKPLSNNEKYHINDLLIKSEVILLNPSYLSIKKTFDHFLTTKKPEFKRYSIEGGESMIILLSKLFGSASENGVD